MLHGEMKQTGPFLCFVRKCQLTNRLTLLQVISIQLVSSEIPWAQNLLVQSLVLESATTPADFPCARTILCGSSWESHRQVQNQQSYLRSLPRILQLYQSHR